MAVRQSTNFTHHAFVRVGERLRLTHAEVAAILDQDLAVGVGIDHFSNRLRRVFYSIPDKAFFVAVQDMKSGSVVTVLPLEYHANLRHAIDEGCLKRAAEMVGCIQPDLGAVLGVKLRTPPSVLRISCSATAHNEVPKFMSLGTWPIANLPENLDMLTQDAEFVRQVRQRAVAKGLSMNAIKRLHVKYGNDGERIDIEIDLSQFDASNTLPRCDG